MDAAAAVVVGNVEGDEGLVGIGDAGDVVDEGVHDDAVAVGIIHICGRPTLSQCVIVRYIEGHDVAERLRVSQVHPTRRIIRNWGRNDNRDPRALGIASDTCVIIGFVVKEVTELPHRSIYTSLPVAVNDVIEKPDVMGTGRSAEIASVADLDAHAVGVLRVDGDLEAVDDDEAGTDAVRA